MGIFSSIKNAIFGDKDKGDKPAASPAPAPAPRGNANARPGTPPAARPAAAQPVAQVDVEAKLDAMDGADTLNWRNSIVDLMKLIGVDSSYENRKELATELGRADYSGSAEDNIWLHKRTMQELGKHGGKVPAQFLD